MQTISREFRATPPQSAFWQSTARVRGYGGAMGGGKSRAICEAALSYAIDYPGLSTLIARQSHTSIVQTTKKTMVTEVLPPELLHVCRKKASMGEDFIELPNGSVLHFIGLDDPGRWYSSEIGLLIVDQVEECTEDTIVRLMTRLRQRNAPLKVILSFNPENPGHWLHSWFLAGAERTKFGFRKPELYTTETDEFSRPLGDAEFFFAKATDNPHLPEGYVEGILAGMPPHLRRRYLDGLWEFISGNSFFDGPALELYQEKALQAKPLLNGRLAGDVHADMLHRTGRGPRPKQPIRPRKGDGPLAVWRAPFRGDKSEGKRPHRYVVGVDVASGKAADYTAMQVICVETFEQVARFQGKLDPDEAAVEAYRLGRIYNNAKIVPEVTGGWGFNLENELKRLRYPNLYTRKVLDRLTKRWTDKTGWDTTVKMRAHMLATLEQTIREHELGLHDLATILELGTFVIADNGKPEAQSGCNDDLVMALAMAVTVAVDQPRQIKELRVERHQPQFALTGY